MEIYRNIRFKLTPQRLAIISFLQGNKSHPSADDVYQAVRKRFPTISLATVYTTLSVLRDRGAVLELILDADKKRYDPDTRLHHHLICLSCKRIEDVSGEIQHNQPPGLSQEFIVVKSQVHYYGYCPKCRTGSYSHTKEDSHVHGS